MKEKFEKWIGFNWFRFSEVDIIFCFLEEFGEDKERVVLRGVILGYRLLNVYIKSLNMIYNSKSNFSKDIM